MRSVLKEAVRRRLIDRNPADDRDLLVRAPAPSRSYLEVAQLAMLLEAADLLERESRRLTREKVGEIRASRAPARALAREFGVSDSLIGKIRPVLKRAGRAISRRSTRYVENRVEARPGRR